MLILGVDFETTGQNVEKDLVVEVGAVMWETDLHAPVAITDFIIYNPGAAWEPGASEKNHLSQEICEAYGKPSNSTLRLFLSWYQQAQVCCAHNGTIFDRLIFNAWCDREGYGEHKDENKIWIDTKTDLDIPAGWSKKLGYLATHYGILNPYPHRAFGDVLTMLMILDHHDINKVMENAKAATVVVQALVPFERKDEAKARGYYWRPEPKQWVKAIKASQLDQEIAEAGKGRTVEDPNGAEIHLPGFSIRILKK